MTDNHPGFQTGYRKLRWTFLILTLASSACALLPQPVVLAPADNIPSDWAASASDPGIIQIDRAELELHTYRAGWLSGLAHNHVIETTALYGDIHLAEPIEGSTARLYFRPWDLVLDDPVSRNDAGAGFESTRTPEDIRATRTRMLGPRGFDSNDYPFVLVTVHWQDKDHAALTLNFRGAQYSFAVPIVWSLSGSQLTARADFEITHGSLGLTPYSAFAGAIAVAEPIRIQFELSATRTPPL